MELFKEILINILKNEEIRIEFPSLEISPNQIIEIECYKTLKKIKTVIENDSLSDFECVEEIGLIFETTGSNCGGRHDFG